MRLLLLRQKPKKFIFPIFSQEKNSGTNQSSVLSAPGNSVALDSMVTPWPCHILLIAPRENSMKFLSVSIKALIIALLVIFTVGRADSQVSDITEQLDSIEIKLEWIQHRLTLEQWEYHVNGVSDSLDFYQDLYRYLLANSDLFKNIPFRLTQVRDQEQKHRLQLLLAKLLPDRVRFKPEISNLSDSLNRLFTYFSSDLQGQMLTLAELNKTYRTSRNRSERENAFRAANAVGDSVSYGMSIIFQLRNKEAAKFGYQNYFDMIASQTPLGTKSVLQLIYKLDSLTQQLFTTISANALNTVRLK